MLVILLVGQLLIGLKANALVEVEPSVYSVTRGDESALPPLGERRGNWGFTAAVGAGYYTPNNYDNFQSFQDSYGSNKTPMVDVQLQVKRNFRRFSLAADAGVGVYSNSYSKNGVNSSISLIPIRIGGSLILDALFGKPYIAPYGSIGGYAVSYKESQAAVNYGGNTQIAVYYAFGSLFLLDWVDQPSADHAFAETGLQATYVYVEARQYMKSNNASDPDFSTGLDPNFGVRLEF